MRTITYITLSESELNELVESSARKAIELYQQSEGWSINSDDIITPAEAARILNISLPTVYSLLKQGKIPSKKRGKKIFIRRSEL
ncbi:helix-turn-helix domain-containing protein [Limibacter armeniacum]|uniref:helix-turn-helix domain-containing protein n=1 Tax=Limibacter armeniacum TaxID=466084 RepID=UPI002FE651F8